MEPIRSIKGTQDLLPQSSYRWQFAENKIKAISETYGYREIRTPVFESTQLFKRGIGELTDVVSKEMYTFEDRGGTSLTLRPEMTASVMRAWIQNNLGQEGGVQKMYYIGSMFRAENVQKGRLRQFHQWGIELVGSPAPVADAEVIMLMMRTLESFGLKSLRLKINSVGDENCRPVYKEILKAYLRPHFDQLCKTCQGRFESNPMRILDCKNETCKTLIRQAPVITDHLNDDCKTHFESVKNLLTAAGIAFEIDPFLVRGLDYYTKTAFEVVSDDLGSQNAVGGGGRYDLLVEQLGGKPTPSVGFAIGIERLLIILEERKLLEDVKPKTPVLFVAAFGQPHLEAMIPVVEKLRGLGIQTEIELLGRSIKAQMREADRLGATYVVVVGDNEMAQKSVSLKNMKTGDQKQLSFDQLVEFLSGSHE